jgi:hypothetical protein
MFDFFLAALSLAPVGLLLLFWRMFPRDRGVHPIYREAGIEKRLCWRNSSWPTRVCNRKSINFLPRNSKENSTT